MMVGVAVNTGTLKMLRFILFLAIGLVSHNAIVGQEVDYSTWNTLLKKYVAPNGDVDYKNFKNDMGDLNTFLEYMALNGPSDNWDKNEKLAYYINIYNAATVKLILDHYPVKSIKDIKNPWLKKRVSIGNRKWALGGIENKILRKMDEPRIHFAINCASYSCPKLLNEAYTPSQLENQLQQATVDFLKDPNRNLITKDSISLSKIFKWYEKDFTEKNTLPNYINQYIESKLPENVKIGYLEYNWNLNEKK